MAATSADPVTITLGLGVNNLKFHHNGGAWRIPAQAVAERSRCQ